MRNTLAVLALLLLPETALAIPSSQSSGVQLDSSNRQIVVGPCGYVPVAGTQLGLVITSSTALTIPATATCAVIQAVGGTAYYTTVASETPVASASGGTQLGAGTAIISPSLPSLQGLHFIGAGGVTLNVTYFK